MPDPLDLTGGGDGDGGEQDSAVGGGSAFWEQSLPDDLPAELASLKGKKLQDLLSSQKSLRQTLTERANKLTEVEKAKADLERSLDEAKKKASALDDPSIAGKRAEEAQKNLQRYQQVVEDYIQTGEADAEFLKAVEGSGVRVTQETMLEFLEFQKFMRGNMVSNLVKYAGDPAVTEDSVKDMLDWMRTGESPFTHEERLGFDRLQKRGNNAWFDTVLEEYQKQFGANGGQPRRPRGRSERRAGRPIPGVEPEGFKNTGDFQNQLIAIRRDKTLTLGQRKAKERELVEARSKQWDRIRPKT